MSVNRRKYDEEFKKNAVKLSCANPKRILLWIRSGQYKGVGGYLMDVSFTVTVAVSTPRVS